jgi:hypothetical protein
MGYVAGMEMVIVKTQYEKGEKRARIYPVLFCFLGQNPMIPSGDGPK